MIGSSLRMLGVAVAAALIVSPAAHAQDGCIADLDGDGVVNGNDLATVLVGWGACVGCAGDVDANGLVDGEDLAAVLVHWGTICAPSLQWATVLEHLPDPSVVTDPVLRKGIIATGLPWRVRDNVTDIEMLLVPPGTSVVTVGSAFYIGRYEVTQAQWTAVMGWNPSAFLWPTFEVPKALVASRPVDQVSWLSIQGFLSSTGLRLPTESEWEYAYRAGTTTLFHSMPGYPNGTNDDAQIGAIAWWGSCCVIVGGNSENQTHPVGQLAANALGLHDMSGNVWEWVGAQPFPDTGSREARGGSWFEYALNCSVSSRTGWPATFVTNDHGFRVARNP